MLILDDRMTGTAGMVYPTLLTPNPKRAASEATTKELTGIASAFKGRDYGVIQAVSDFDLERDQSRFEEEWKVVEEYVRAAGGRPFSFCPLRGKCGPNG